MSGYGQASAMTAPFRAVTFAGIDGAASTFVICPNTKVLHTTGTVHNGNMLRYRASKFDCNACAEDAMLSERGCPTGTT
jgi:hypothetical protein